MTAGVGEASYTDNQLGKPSIPKNAFLLYSDPPPLGYLNYLTSPLSNLRQTSEFELDEVANALDCLRAPPPLFGLNPNERHFLVWTASLTWHKVT